ncbi:MAG: YceI family protein [Oligoflexales bacterium]
MKTKIMGNLLVAFLGAALAGKGFATPEAMAKVTLFPAGSFEAKTSSVIGTLKKAGTAYTGNEIKIPVETLKTGISLRDKHLGEKLEAKKFPYIIANNINATGDKGKANIQISGVTKEVDFELKDLGNNTAQVIFTLNLPDFKIEGISYKGVGVEDKTEVTAIVPYEG